VAGEAGADEDRVLAAQGPAHRRTLSGFDVQGAGGVVVLAPGLTGMPATTAEREESPSSTTTRTPRRVEVTRNNRRSVFQHEIFTPFTEVHILGDLKLFEPKTTCPFIAVRDCRGAVAGPGLAMWIEVDVTCRLQDGRCA
jgi:hypothetical protein